MKKTVILFFAALISLQAAASVTMSSPASGSTVSSPLHVAASATGNSGLPITGMYVYLDNVAVYHNAAASLSTYLNAALGSHTVLVKAWDSHGTIYQQSATVNVGSTSSSGYVNLTSPASGSSAGSPVHVTATSGGGAYPITGMWAYVDNVGVYNTSASAVDTYLSMGSGTHTVLVKAWNTQGTIFQQAATVTVGSSSTSSTSTSSSQYQNDLLAASNALAKTWIRADGAILYSSLVVNPYYANIAAIGMTKDPNRYGAVLNWMKWYVRHLNWPDKWGLYGSMYDYNVSGSGEVSTGDADSTDSYAATFLTLAWSAWQTGDSGLRSYISSISYQLDMIGGVIAQTQQSDGLTWAKPDYQIKYLMDNTEVYRGLRDLASLFNALGDPSKSSYYGSLANSNLQGINAMWMGSAWAVYKDGIGRLAAPNWGTWYADATAQLFPVLEGAVAASDARSQQVYATFNSHWSGWPTLSFNSQDAFPWALVQSAAALMGDKSRVNTYMNTVQSKYVNTGFPWPWYCMETGWFLRTNSYMQGHGF